MVPRSFILPRGAVPCAFLLALLGVSALAVLANNNSTTKAHTIKTKEPAPRFNARTTEGEKFSNESIKGKVVLLEFWTTWCGFCAQEAPFVDRINREFADKDLIVLAVDVGESKKTVKKYLEQHPRNCKIVLMEDTNLAAMYVATVYPIYVVIDRDGYISGTQRGAAGEDALRELLAAAGLESKSASDAN